MQKWKQPHFPSILGLWLFFTLQSVKDGIVAKALKKSFFQQSTYSLKNDFTSNLHYSHTIVPAESAFTSP